MAQIVNFAILVVVLTKLLYRPILGMLAKRKKEIAEGLAITERMRLEEEKLGERREKLLAQARGEARVILEDAKSQAKDAERAIMEAAHKEAAAVIEKAKGDARSAHDALAGAIRREAVDLAAAMAKRLVAGALTSADQHKLIEKHLKAL